MSKIALISCTKDKLDYACPAIELYTKSTAFRFKLCYCKRIGVDRIFILSAKHHLLEPETVISPYDETLKGAKKDVKIKWTEKVVDDLRNKTDIENDEFIILAGADYTKYLLDYLPNNHNPAKGLRSGQQLQFFKSYCSNMIDAVELRGKLELENKPGYYKWWAKEEEFNFILDKLNVDFDEIKGHVEVNEGLYSIYVGIAVKESVAKRLDWHVNDKHSQSKIQHGTLSTFRQSLSSVISSNQADEAKTNNFIDKLKIEYFLSDYPIRSAEAKDELEAIEKNLLQENLYILNIQDNHHPLSKPIKKELRRLRKESKQRALNEQFH